MQVYKIDWMETHAGFFIRPNGYSFHTTPEAAQGYLAAMYENLPDKIPEEYSFPSAGWRQPARAVLVEIPDNSVWAEKLAQSGSCRIFPSYGEASFREYPDAGLLKAIGEPIQISYGEQGYTPAEQELLSMHQEIEEEFMRGVMPPSRAVALSRAVIKYLGMD